MTRLIIITAKRILSSKNQIQLAILKFGDLGHQIGSFSNTYSSDRYRPMSMKIFAMFGQNPSNTFDKILEKQHKSSHSLTMSPNVNVIAEIKRQ